MSAQSQPGGDGFAATPTAEPSAAHTPGPWLWQHSGDGDGRYIVWTRQPHTGELAAVNCEDINGGYPAEANARLIAAAPDLLEALTELVLYHDVPAEAQDPVVVPLLRAAFSAIARAEGRSQAGTTGRQTEPREEQSKATGEA